MKNELLLSFTKLLVEMIKKELKIEEALANNELVYEKWRVKIVLVPQSKMVQLVTLDMGKMSKEMREIPIIMKQKFNVREVSANIPGSVLIKFQPSVDFKLVEDFVRNLSL